MSSSNPSGPSGSLGLSTDPVNPMRVPKATQAIILVLQDGTQVRGLVHLPPSGRLSDLMNHQAGEKPFLAMTRAAIRLPDGTCHTAPFMAVNRLAVGTCFPLVEAHVRTQSAADGGNAAAEAGRNSRTGMPAAVPVGG